MAAPTPVRCTARWTRMPSWEERFRRGILNLDPIPSAVTLSPKMLRDQRDLCVVLGMRRQDSQLPVPAIRFDSVGMRSNSCEIGSGGRFRPKSEKPD
jgi:hypothetical protein